MRRKAVSRLIAASGIVGVCAFVGVGPAAAAPDTADIGMVDVVDLGVTGALNAMEIGKVTSEQLVQAYLDRITGYDGHAPMDGGLGAIVSLNPNALTEARDRDRQRREGEIVGPLHGVPVLVKDNINTAEMPTSQGNKALSTYQPFEDSGVVERLRKAGAIVIGKTNMAEFAAYWDTQSSVRGRTLNPYNITRNVSGSSGGSGAGVTSSFAAFGIGTESCGSLTDVASFTNLVGLRPTPGLVSRAGIDYNPIGDTAGPLALNVEDAARALDVLVGTDPADPLTADAYTHKPASYLNGLSDTSLQGKRIGYFVHPLGGYDFTVGPGSDSVLATADQAMMDMAARGATIVPIDISRQWLDTYMPKGAEYWGSGGREDYFLRTDAKVPDGLASETEPKDKINYGDLIAADHDLDPVTEKMLQSGDNFPTDSAAYQTAVDGRSLVEKGVEALEAQNGLDFLAYPTMSAPPVTLHDVAKPVSVDAEQFGTSCGWATFTGRPVITVPAGFDNDGLPVGVSLLGQRYGESALLGVAYDYEHSTPHRIAPDLSAVEVNIADKAKTDSPGGGAQMTRAGVVSVTVGALGTVVVASYAIRRRSRP
ncbi:amidase family protein [Rhodococcus globerulus]|uniref:Amidase family protein n=1 Tax=Rhodococcus globerulus TaxID=33008 RepID=A0ABU4C4V3_RHOGO|nr:amidase family protein [Rhodococcus globerulus]MDV6271444.1 amidase family protein [Rhodococcus globerulus]